MSTRVQGPRILPSSYSHSRENKYVGHIVHSHEDVGKDVLTLTRSGRRSKSMWNLPERSFSDWHTAESRRGVTRTSAKSLQQRLTNANDHFRRKASEVFNDKASLKLLEGMYRDVVVDISEFDVCKHGLAFAKLTAASFCEVGANVIYITEAGQRFIDSIQEHK